MSLIVLALVRPSQHRSSPIYRVRCSHCGSEYQRSAASVRLLEQVYGCKSCAAKRRWILVAR
jgi:predicted SprT family Zn-dependent metalloprotease